MSNIKHNHRLNLKKTEAQFQLMKSNINIPFMLDALNYTESIAKESPGNAEEPIILLSNVLRYGLYETQSTFIPLYRELEVLEEYILLQNQIDRQCTLKLNTLSLLENVPIVPNILVRFVGYWKHIMDNRLEGQQQINIFAEHNTLLMNLPLSADIDNLKNLLEKRFPIFQDVNFVVTYFINNESLVLKIVNLAK
jgi:LytS/YehU family sensor histidine kinase